MKNEKIDAEMEKKGAGARRERERERERERVGREGEGGGGVIRIINIGRLIRIVWYIQRWMPVLGNSRQEHRPHMGNNWKDLPNLKGLRNISFLSVRLTLQAGR